MNLHPIPAFSDNYIWALHHQGQALVVDPGDPNAVLTWLSENQLQLKAIFVTHHHSDHTAGVAELQHRTQAQIYAPATEWLNNGLDCISVSAHTCASIRALDLNWHILDVPGHTLGHVAYWCSDAGLWSCHPHASPIVFCGDTLFSAGCGRLFEGTHEEMYTSLQQLSALPDATLVCCAHEYTLSNLRFARTVEPDNAILKRYETECEHKRSERKPTLPSTIGLEKQINPFLRVLETSVKRAVFQHGNKMLDNPQDVLGALRQWKNDF